jgi:Cu/Ag efflux protein CusF
MIHIKTILTGLLICGILFCLGCGRADTKRSNTAASSTSEPKDGNYTGKGKVTKIDMNIGSVEMDHEDIKDLMPAMRMEFYVSDKAMLSPLTVGDTVDFTILYKGGTETIIKIEKAK